jgi:peptide/nickel transport system substrate-binding protein
MLDEAGFAERNADGIRLGPDGEPITIVLTYVDGFADFSEVLEFVQRDWREVGIDLQPRGMPRASYADIVFENQHDAAIWQGNPAGIRVQGDPRYYLPANGESLFGNAWAFWGQNPDDPRAEEPSVEAARRQIELYNEMRQTIDQERQEELMREILQIGADAFWVIGISTPLPDFGVYTNNFRGVPENMPSAWEYPTPGPANTFTFFFAE